MKSKVLLSAVIYVAVLFLISSAALGQGTTSRVTGIVLDANGGAVVGTTVTLTNEATGISFTTETSQSGSYAFDLVQVGSYTLTFEKQGFKKFLSKGNAINVNQPATINAALEPGGVAESVTVTATAEQVQTSTSGNIGSTIDQKTLEGLPIVGTRGRNPLDLLNFQPGVVIGGNTGGGVSVNGSRDRAFNFTLDGIDINESTAGGSNFTPLRPNPDSVQEFQVVTSNFTAELGRSSGAQVTLVTRSGTNHFHGNGFEYYRSPRFDAKSYPITIALLPKEQFVQHIFGGSIGGPIKKDKLFFFTNLQLLRAYDTALVTRTVYTAAARSGLFRYVVGRANAPANAPNASVDAAGNPTLPACTGTPPTNAPCISSYNIATNPSGIGIDPALAGIINAMPTPNNFAAGDGLNTAGFNFASPQHERQYDFVTKVDYNLRANSLIYVRYAQGSQSSFGDSANGGRPIFPGSPNFVDTGRTPKNLAVNWRWSPTASVTNEAIVGISKYFFTFATPHPDPALPFTFLNPATPNTNFSYNARGVNTLQLIDNLTFIRGSHTLKGGTNLRFNRHRDDRSSVAGSAIEPVVSFSSAAGFTGFALPTAGSTSINSTDLTRLQNTIVDELGRIGSVSQAFISNGSSFAPAGTRWLNKATYPELDFYFQDSWRFRPNLVFDLGLSSKNLWGQSPMTIGLVREARARGLSVTVDQYAYTASSTSLDSRLPTWLRAGGLEAAKKRLADSSQRERVIKEMKEGLKHSGFKDYDYAMVASYDPDRSFNGKSIAAITRQVHGKSDLKSQIEQIIAMYEAGGAGMVYHGMSEQDVQNIMREPFTMIASDSGVRQVDESVPHPRGYGNNVRVLGHYVRDLKLISLEDAIRKMTSLPAQTFGFRDRGLLRPGFAADLVIFDENTINDRATFDKPHQYATGISFVLVNGEVVFADGAMTSARPGVALRGPAITVPAPAAVSNLNSIFGER